MLLPPELPPPRKTGRDGRSQPRGHREEASRLNGLSLQEVQAENLPPTAPGLGLPRATAPFMERDTQRQGEVGRDPETKSQGETERGPGGSNLDGTQYIRGGHTKTHSEVSHRGTQERVGRETVG